MSRPDRPGWYWYRDGDHVECVAVDYRFGNKNLLRVYWTGQEESVLLTDVTKVEWLGEAIPPTEISVVFEGKPTKSGFSAVITDRASMEQVIDVLDDRLRYERDAALEEAAKLCDEMTAAEVDPEYTSEDCAAEIRALKSNTPSTPAAPLKPADDQT